MCSWYVSHQSLHSCSADMSIFNWHSNTSMHSWCLHQSLHSWSTDTLISEWDSDRLMRSWYASCQSLHLCSADMLISDWHSSTSMHSWCLHQLLHSWSADMSVSQYTDAQCALTISVFDLLILVIKTKKQTALCHTLTLVWQRILTFSLYQEQSWLCCHSGLDSIFIMSWN